MNRYPEYLMRIMWEMDDLHPTDTSRDDSLLRLNTPNEVFEQYLEFVGIIGYAGSIKDAIQDIYGVDLKEARRENVGYVITNSIKIASLEIVMGEADSKDGKKYVTWQCRNGNDYNHGHYYDNELNAKADFCKRVLTETAFLKSMESPDKDSHER